MDRDLTEVLEDACSALSTGDTKTCHELIHEAIELAEQQKEESKVLCPTM